MRMPRKVELDLLVCLTFENVKQWRMEVWHWFMGRHEVSQDIDTVFPISYLVSDSREMNSPTFLPLELPSTS